MADWISRWEVNSRTSSKVYTVAMKADGTFGCDCPAWKFHKAPKPDCPHILKVKATERRATPQEIATMVPQPPPRSLPRASDIRLTPAELKKANGLAALDRSAAQYVPGGRNPVTKPAAPVAEAYYVVQKRRAICLEE